MRHLLGLFFLLITNQYVLAAENCLAVDRRAACSIIVGEKYTFHSSRVHGTWNFGNCEKEIGVPVFQTGPAKSFLCSDLKNPKGRIRFLHDSTTDLLMAYQVVSQPGE